MTLNNFIGLLLFNIITLIGATNMQGTQCTISWTRFNDSNYRGSNENSAQPTEEGCLDECNGTPGCIAVDIDRRNITITLRVYCFFHSDDDDLDMLYNNIGVDTYVRKVDCPGGIVPGMPGAETLWKTKDLDAGATGIVGFPGPPGLIGVQGQVGALGSTGFTGNPGMAGTTGQTGATGFIGSVGSQGNTGWTGSIGTQGYTGSTGIGIYGEGNGCNVSIVTLNGVMSPGSDTGRIAANQLACRDICVNSNTCVAMEYILSDFTCKLHNTIDNLKVRIPQAITDQSVIISRCSTTDSNDFTGYLDISQSTGPTGVSGATGPFGLTGDTGFTGYMGMTGMTGLRGRTGIDGLRGQMGFEGSTGSNGATGIFGRTGVTGSLGNTGPQGEVINVKTQCNPQWVLINDVRSPGSTPYPRATTVEACMDICLASPDCVAVDFVVSSNCFLVKHYGRLSDKVNNPGAIQLVLVGRCSLGPDTPSKQIPTGIYESLKKNKHLNEKPKNNSDKSSDLNFEPWPLTFMFTLVSIVVTDGVCYVVFLTWKKFSNKSFHGRF